MNLGRMDNFLEVSRDNGSVRRSINYGTSIQCTKDTNYNPKLIVKETVPSLYNLSECRMKHKNKDLSLNMVVYDEPIEIIYRCMDSVYDLLDKIYIIAHEDYPIDLNDIILSIYFDGNTDLCEVDVSYENLNDTVVEEWRNTLIDRSTTDLILILDPDEYLDNEARYGIKSIKYGITSIDDPYCAGVCFSRRNNEYDNDLNPVYDNNYPDYQFRLLKRGYARYSGRVHRQADIKPSSYVTILGNGSIIHDKLYETKESIMRKKELYERKEKSWINTML